MADEELRMRIFAGESIEALAREWCAAHGIAPNRYTMLPVYRFARANLRMAGELTKLSDEDEEAIND